METENRAVVARVKGAGQAESETGKGVNLKTVPTTPASALKCELVG